MKPSSLPVSDMAAMRRKMRRASSSWAIPSRDSMSCIHAASISGLERPPWAWRYGLAGWLEDLERLCQLGELQLVVEADLDLPAGDPGLEARQALERRL